jgi:hypothetical protein
MSIFINNISIFLMDRFPELDNSFINEFLPFIVQRDKCEIDFDKAYKWIGYTSAQNARNMLIKYFVENDDYIIENINENIKKQQGGQNKINIKINYKTFEQFGMLARTKNGSKMRKYMSMIQEIIIDSAFNNMFNKKTKKIKVKKEFNIIDYYDQELIYLICFNKNFYKFGITNNIKKRLVSHTRDLNFEYVVNVWKMPDRSFSTNAENKIKKLIKSKNISRIYKKQTEIFETTDIQDMIDHFNKYVKFECKRYKETQITFQQKIDLKIQKRNMKLVKAIKSIQSKSDNPKILQKMLSNIKFEKEEDIGESEYESDNENIIMKDNIEPNVDVVNIIIEDIDFGESNIKKDTEFIVDMTDDLINKKMCGKCKQIKDLKCFIPSRGKKHTKNCDICKEKEKNKPSRNPEKKKEYNKQYNEKNNDKIKEQQKEYGEKNKEKKKEYNKQYREDNLDKITKKEKESYEKNKEKKLEQKKEYYKKNKEEIRIKQKIHYDNTYVKIPKD